MEATDTRALVAEAVAQVPAALPNVPVLNLVPWRKEAREAGRLDAVTTDRFHLSDEGFRSLEPALRRLGVQLHEVDTTGAAPDVAQTNG